MRRRKARSRKRGQDQKIGWRVGPVPEKGMPCPDQRVLGPFNDPPEYRSSPPARAVPATGDECAGEIVVERHTRFV